MTRTVVGLGCALAFAATGYAQSFNCALQALEPSVAQPLQWFGCELGMDEGRLLVGAPQHSVGGARRGAVFAFARDAAGVFRETQLLEPTVSVPYMRYGVRLDVVGDTAVISAPGDSPGTFGGGVFVFRYDDVTGLWVETQFLTVPNADFYGSMVHLQGDRLVVSEAWGVSFNVGRVHLYERSSAAGPFALVQTIVGPLAHNNNRFAEAATFVGDDMLLLADADAPALGIDSAGLIRIYRRVAPAGVWSEVGSLVSPDPNPHGAFGSTLAWDGRQLVVGEYRDGVSSFPADGAAHVFELDASGSLTPVQRIERPGGYDGWNYFGSVLQLRDGQLLLRDYLVRTFDHRPVVRRFQRDDVTGHWFYVGFYEDPTTPGNTDFALAAAIDAHSLVVGACWSSVAGTPQGRAHVFDARDCGTLGALECSPGANNSTGLPAHLTLHGSASAGRDLLVVTATELPPGEPGLLLAGCNSGSGVLPGTLGTLCIDAPAAFTRLVVPASVHGTWRIELPLRAIPLGSGFVAVRPGESWTFQLWYRDSGLPAKLSNAVRLTFS